MDNEKAKVINKGFSRMQGRSFERYLQSQKETLQMVFNEAYKKGYQDGRNSQKKDAK